MSLEMPCGILDLDARHVWHPFTQAATAGPPLPIVSASGAVLRTEDGRELLDLISSWWVTLHGHAHPVIAEAVAAQARKLEQVIFAGFTHEPAVRLAARVAGLLPGGLNRVFYTDNGSTAVEAALKMAHQYWRNQGRERTVYVGFDGGYHGDTVGAMSAGRASGFFATWERLLFPVEVAPYPATWDGDPEPQAAEAKAFEVLDRIFDASRDRIAAVIVEPLVQGAGGMRMCRPEFLRGLCERVRAAGTLLIFDEVMTGFGRTGAHFACCKAGVEPDIVCLAKGLSGGFLPLAMTVAQDRIHDAFLGPGVDTAFLHGHSFTANPLGCAAGLASLDLLLATECQERIAAIEDVHRERMAELGKLPGMAKPRVCGAIAAIDLDAPDAGYASAVGPRLKQALLDKGLLLRPLGNVLYLLPPYCVTDEQMHRAYDGIAGVLKDIVG